MAKELDYTQEQIDSLFKGVYEGKINLISLPSDLYDATNNLLNEGIQTGYGLAGNPETKALLSNSIAKFSAAKQFQFISEMQNFLFDEKGFLIPFEDFKKYADGINSNYNVNWLQAEYNTTHSMARSTKDWEDIQVDKDIFPMLKYETKRDPKVRNEHVGLNGIVLPVDHDFWIDHFPPNGWRCRCQAIKREGGKPTDLGKKKLPKLDDVFRGNAGITKQVFNDKHPYFKVPKEFEKHKKNNFGL